MKKMMRMVALLALLLVGAATRAQEVEKVLPKVNVKVNGLGVIGIINPAIEVGVSRRMSFQLEGLGVYAANNYLGSGYPCSLTLFYGEWRYYIKERFNGFFAGIHTGGGVFRLNKNLMDIFSYTKNVEERHIGHSYVLGITAGYQLQLGERWALELVVGYGRQYARYEAYIPDNLGTATHTAVNGSAEYLPTKGGLMVAYRF